MKSLTGTDQLSKITLRGYKSIAECQLEMGALNILIGCNGAGKSNFISFFQLIQQILQENLQVHVSKQGGPDALLHFGRKVTEYIEVRLYFGNNGYWCTLEPTADNRMMFAEESFWWKKTGKRRIGEGHFETKAHKGTGSGIDKYVLPPMRQWRVYHFHDTGENSPIKQPCGINDNTYLRPDAKNLSAYLYLLKQKHPDHFQRIVKTVRLVAPFFGGFHLRPFPHNENMIELEWVEKGRDVPFKTHHLSDGTLRFICLTTVFQQPAEKQPTTILVDEPELGLHPYAIKVLASLIKSASQKKQIVISTQSVELLDEFDAEDVIVVDRKDSQSLFRRLKEDNLSEWLDECGKILPGRHRTRQLHCKFAYPRV